MMQEKAYDSGGTESLHLPAGKVLPQRQHDEGGGGGGRP